MACATSAAMTFLKTKLVNESDETGDVGKSELSNGCIAVSTGTWPPRITKYWLSMFTDARLSVTVLQGKAL